MHNVCDYVHNNTQLLFDYNICIPHYNDFILNDNNDI